MALSYTLECFCTNHRKCYAHGEAHLEAPDDCQVKLEMTKIINIGLVRLSPRQWPEGITSDMVKKLSQSGVGMNPNQLK